MSVEIQAEPYVCVIGAASVDLAGHSKSPVVMRDSNPGSLHVSWGGVGRNIAENLARLDVPVHLVTVLGDDIFSRQLQRHATDCGISMHARIVQDAVTPAYVCINDTNGELVVAVAAMKLLDQLDEGWVQENAQIIDGAGLCVIDANLGGELIGFMLDKFPRQDFFVDAVSTAKAERLKPFLGRFVAIKMNRGEAGFLAGIEISGMESLQGAAHFFIEKGIRQVFISLGSDGMFYADAQNCGSLPSLPGVDTISTSGAGDAMMAGLAAADLRGLGLEDAAQQAVAAAAITLQHAKAVNPDISVAALQKLREKYGHA